MRLRAEELPSLPVGAAEGQAGLLPSLLREELLRPGLLRSPEALRPGGLCSGAVRPCGLRSCGLRLRVRPEVPSPPDGGTEGQAGLLLREELLRPGLLRSPQGLCSGLLRSPQVLCPGWLQVVQGTRDPRICLVGQNHLPNDELNGLFASRPGRCCFLGSGEQGAGSRERGAGSTEY